MMASYIFDAKSKMLDNGYIYNLLAVVPILFAGLIFINPTGGIVLLVLSMLVNAIIYFRLKLRLDRELAVIRYFSSMLFACSQILKNVDSELKDMLGELAENYNVFKSIKGKISNSAQRTLSPADALLEYFKMVFLTDIRKYNRIINKINKEHEAFHALYKEFGELDIAICTLSFAKA
jgi:hypothetical protein